MTRIVALTPQTNRSLNKCPDPLTLSIADNPIVTLPNPRQLIEHLQRNESVVLLLLAPKDISLNDHVAKYSNRTLVFRNLSRQPGWLADKIVQLKIDDKGPSGKMFSLAEGNVPGFPLLPFYEMEANPSIDDCEQLLQDGMLPLVEPHCGDEDREGIEAKQLRQELLRAMPASDTANLPAVMQILARIDRWAPLLRHGVRLRISIADGPTRLELQLPAGDHQPLWLINKSLTPDNLTPESLAVINAVIAELRGDLDDHRFGIIAAVPDPTRRCTGSAPDHGAWQMIQRWSTTIRSDLATQICNTVVEPCRGDPPSHAEAARRLTEILLPGTDDAGATAAVLQLIEVALGGTTAWPQVDDVNGQKTVHYDPDRQDPNDLVWRIPLGTRLEPQARVRVIEPPIDLGQCDGIEFLDLSRSLIIDNSIADMSLRVCCLRGRTTSGKMVELDQKGCTVDLPRKASLIDIKLGRGIADWQAHVRAANMEDALPGGQSDELFLGRYEVDRRKPVLRLVKRPRVVRLSALQPFEELRPWWSLFQIALEQIIHDFPPLVPVVELGDRWPEMDMCELLQRLESLGARLQGKLAPATRKRFIPHEHPGEEFPRILIQTLRDACQMVQGDPLRRGEHYHVTPLPCNGSRIHFSDDTLEWATQKGLAVRMRLPDPTRRSVLLLNPDRHVRTALQESGCYELGPLPESIFLGDVSQDSSFSLFPVSINHEVPNGHDQ